MKNTLQTILAASLPLLLTAAVVRAQDVDDSMPRIIEKNGRHALLVDGKPYFMLGGQCGNSNAWPTYLPQLWRTVEAMNANTVEIPIYWEQIEPQPGQFDFSVVDTIIKQAREHNLRLVLLWFGTWKNGSNHYMPEWMKLDSAKYPNIKGIRGQEVDSPSPHTQAAMELDAKAFTEVMKHLKQFDPQHTVIIMQVENEPGSWGSVRDFSPAAEELFARQVPPELLKPELLKALGRPENAKGTWREVFGKDADEYFHAYSVASYINFVAKAGKAVNPLPMYVNVALRNPLTNPAASTYESGGATDNVIPIYKVAAPAINWVSPDIYLTGEAALKVMDLYCRPDNPLIVPESGSNVDYLYQVLSRGGLGYAPFGVDSGSLNPDAAPRVSPLSADYGLLRPMASDLAKWNFEGKLHVLPSGASQTLDCGNWQAVLTMGGTGGRGGRGGGAPAAATVPTADGTPGEPPTTQATGTATRRGGAGGRAGAAASHVLFAQPGDNEFMIIGSQLSRITFKTIGTYQGRPWQFLKVEEGIYENGKFTPLRIRNGDQTDFGGPSIGTETTILHITLTPR